MRMPPLTVWPWTTCPKPGQSADPKMTGHAPRAAAFPAHHRRLGGGIGHAQLLLPLPLRPAQRRLAELRLPPTPGPARASVRPGTPPPPLPTRPAPPGRRPAARARRRPRRAPPGSPARTLPLPPSARAGAECGRWSAAARPPPPPHSPALGGARGAGGAGCPVRSGRSGPLWIGPGRVRRRGHAGPPRRRLTPLLPLRPDSSSSRSSSSSSSNSPTPMPSRRSGSRAGGAWPVQSFSSP